MTRRGRCYACDMEARGLKPTEDHHVYGRDHPAKATMPANHHRALTALARGRRAALKRLGDNPLLNVAVLVAVGGEIAAAVADYAGRQEGAQWIAELASLLADAASSAADWLLWLDGWLADRLGPDWHREAESWRPPSRKDERNGL
jgi:hypothetical protein